MIGSFFQACKIMRDVACFELKNACGRPEHSPHQLTVTLPFCPLHVVLVRTQAVDTTTA